MDTPDTFRLSKIANWKAPSGRGKMSSKWWIVHYHVGSFVARLPGLLLNQLDPRFDNAKTTEKAHRSEKVKA